MPWGPSNLAAVPTPSDQPLAPSLPANTFTKPLAVSMARIMWRLLSETMRRDPLDNDALPNGVENSAVSTTPDLDPEIAAEPLYVVTSHTGNVSGACHNDKHETTKSTQFAFGRNSPGTVGGGGGNTLTLDDKRSRVDASAVDDDEPSQTNTWPVIGSTAVPDNPKKVANEQEFSGCGLPVAAPATVVT